MEKLGTFENGILVINEGIECLESHSITGYEGLKKIVMPSSLKKVGTSTIVDQGELEEVDFSKVTQLKELPDGFIEGKNKITRFVVPYGVQEVGDCFVGKCPQLKELYVPHTVKSMAQVNGYKKHTINAYVFSSCPALSLMDSIEDILNLYVLPDSYDMYEEELTYLLDLLEIGIDDVDLKEIPENLRSFYGEDAGKELDWKEYEVKPLPQTKENLEVFVKEHTRVESGRLKKKIGFWGAVAICALLAVTDFFFLEGLNDWTRFLLFVLVGIPVILLWLWAWGYFNDDPLI